MRKIFLFLLIVGSIDLFSLSIVSVNTTSSQCSASGSATVNISGATGSVLYFITVPPSGNYSSASSSNVFSSLAAGNYTVRVTDAVTTQTIAITISGSYVNPSYTPAYTLATCYNIANAIAASGSVTGGLPPFQWTLSSTTTTIGPQASSVFTGLAPNSYSMTLVDACNNIQVRPFILPNTGGNVASGISGIPFPTKNGCNTFTIQSSPLYGFSNANDRKPPYTMSVLTSNGSFNTSYTFSPAPSAIYSPSATITDYATTTTISIVNNCGFEVYNRVVTTDSIITITQGLSVCDRIYTVNGASSFLAPITYSLINTTTNSVVVTQTDNPVFSGAYAGQCFRVKLTDACGTTATSASFCWNAVSIPVLLAAPLPDFLCRDSTTTMNLYFSGGGYILQSVQILNGPLTAQSTRTNSLNYNYNYSYPSPVFGSYYSNKSLLSGFTSGTYTVQAWDEGGCFTNTFVVTIPPSALKSLNYDFSYTAGCVNSNKINLSSNFPISFTVTRTSPTTSVIPNSGGLSASGGGSVTLNNMSSGTYVITASSGGAQDGNLTGGTCSSISHTLVIPPYVNPAFTVPDAILCKGSLTSSVSVTSGLAPYVYQVSVAGANTYSNTSSTFSVPSNGLYDIRVIDACGNSAVSSISTNTASVPLALGGSVCLGNNVKLYGQSNSQYIRYDWLSPNNSLYTGDTLHINPISLSSYGTYTIAQITDFGVCKDTVIKTLVLSNTTPTLNITGANAICTGATATLTASGGDSYNWLNQSVVSNSVQVTPPSTVVYTVVGTNAIASCTSAITHTLLVNSNPSILSSSSSSVACFGATTGSASIVATGGTPGYTYSWTSVGSTTNSATGLASGNYTATVTDVNLCKATQSFVIAQPASAVSIASSNSYSVLCFGASTGSAAIVATGGTPGYTYSWTSVGSTTNLATGLAVGNYTATVKDANLCITTQSFAITEPTSAVSILSSNTYSVLCFGASTGSAAIIPTGGTPGYTYSWTSVSSTTNSATGLAVGNYTAIVKDANLCITTQSFAITEPTYLDVVLTATTQADCGLSNGSASVTASGGTPAYSYSWTPPSPASSFTTSVATTNSLSAGITQLAVRDANGCVTPLFITISNPNAPVITPTQTNVLCYGNLTGVAQVSVTGGTPTYSYSWTPSVGTFTDIATNLASGNYTLLVVDVANCTAGYIFTITQPTAPLTASAVATNSVLCYGDITGSATTTITGGTPTYTVNWEGNTSVTNSAAAYAAGNYTYQVTDANGCITSNSFAIIQPTAALSVMATQTNVACFGASTGSATITASGGTSSYSYNWTTSPSTTNTATGLTAGDYTTTVTDNNGCSITQTISITEPSDLITSVTATTQASCGLANGQATITTTGGTPGYTYSWTSSSSSYTTIVATTNSLSAGNNQVIITDANGCTTSTIITITNPNAPVVTTTVTDVACYGVNSGAVLTTVLGGSSYTYTWSNGSHTASIINVFSGAYTLIVRDANNCMLAQTYTVNQPSSAVDLQLSNIIPVSCYGGNTGAATALASGGTPNYTYTWQPVNSNTSTINNLVTGNYTVTTTDANGCITSSVIAIVYNPSISLQAMVINSESSVCEQSNGSITVGVTGGTPSYNYVWNTGTSSNETLSNISEGNYEVIVTDALGCKDTVKVSLDCKINLFIPEIFSPNGDGKNDKFEIKGIESYPNNTLKIFNRWGSLIYSKNKYKNEWDGKANVGDKTGAEFLPAATYYVVLDFGNGKTEPYHGFVQLEF